MQCIGHFKLLFGLLRLNQCPEMQARTLEVISQTAINQECVNDIAAGGGLAYLLILFETLPGQVSLCLSTLFTLASNTKIVKDLLETGKFRFHQTDGCLSAVYANFSRRRRHLRFGFIMQSR